MSHDEKLATLQNAWNDINQHPIGYVASVTYGRWVFLTIESNHSSDKIKATLDASLSTMASSGEMHLSAEQRKILSESKLQYFVLGDTTNSVLPIAAENLFSKLKELLGTPQQDVMRYALPISFRVNYLRDNSLRRLQSATEFETSVRSPYAIEDLVAHFRTNDDNKDHNTSLDVFIWDNDHSISSGIGPGRIAATWDQRDSAPRGACARCGDAAGPGDPPPY